jgi:hypothetical protein
MMNAEEIKALEEVVAYLVDNEYQHSLEHLEEGGKPENHIYDKAMTLAHYINGLYSTGVIK